MRPYLKLSEWDLLKTAVSFSVTGIAFSLHERLLFDALYQRTVGIRHIYNICTSNADLVSASWNVGRHLPIFPTWLGPTRLSPALKSLVSRGIIHTTPCLERDHAQTKRARKYALNLAGILNFYIAHVTSATKEIKEKLPKLNWGAAETLLNLLVALRAPLYKVLIYDAFPVEEPIQYAVSAVPRYGRKRPPLVIVSQRKEAAEHGACVHGK